MKRKLINCLILIFLIFFTSQIFSQSQIKLLEQAYKEESDSLMNLFFKEWENMTPYQYDNYSNANDTIKAIKEIYKSFYDSLNFFRKDKINILPNDFKYSIVKYVYYFQWYLDSALFEIEKNNPRRDTLPCPEIILHSGLEKTLYSTIITKFRPIVTTEQVVFLDSLYCGRVNSFLIGKFRKLPWANLWKDLDFSPGKYLARADFLNKFLSIRQSGQPTYDKHNIYYYNKYLELFSKNTIYSISIDETLTYCIVRTEDDNCVNHYYMCKTNNGWKIKKRSGICWCG